VTTASPRAASVGARSIASTSASVALSWSKRSTASTAPRAIVKGNPTPSRRRGTAYSRLSTRGLIRDASANNTTARVASASVRTTAPVGADVTSSMTSGPASTPARTNAIGGVTGVPVIRRDTAATARTVAAMIASSHFTLSTQSLRAARRILRIR
jgi:hypothetical protein